MGSKTAVLKTCRFSGFNHTFERFQRIPDIQDKTRKPIMIPTANVAIRSLPKLAFSFYPLGSWDQRCRAIILPAAGMDDLQSPTGSAERAGRRERPPVGNS